MSGETILVAEDNVKNMRLVTLLLKSLGYRALQAQDGEEALRLAQEAHPDLILMDIQLPKFSGVEVAEALRANGLVNGTPIIALTAHAMQGDRERFLDAGFAGYISKPINTREFSGILRSFLDHTEGTAQE